MTSVDRSTLCATCALPIGLCACPYASPLQWAWVQAFRRECYPESYSEFMADHVVVAGTVRPIDA